MMDFQIRPAKKEDCPRMMELIRELALYEKAAEEVTVSMDEFIDAGFGDHPTWAALVAQVNGAIIGIALYYVRYSTWKGRRLYLEDIVITEEMRGKGYGKQLLEQTMELAKAEGYSGMMWQVLEWNEPAKAFYKKYDTKFEGEWINVKIDF